MSTVDRIKPTESEAWDAFVMGHPLGRIYHLTTWKSVIESAFPHIHGDVLVIRNNDGEIQGGMPIYNVRSWLLKNRIVSVPFATVCDPLFSTGEDFLRCWEVILNTYKRNNSKRVEIRTYKASKDCLPIPMRKGAIYMHHSLLLEPSEEALLRSFQESCIRSRIKKASKSGVIVEEAGDIESLRQFHAMLAATRRRLALLPMPIRFFEAIHQWMIPEHARLYLARSGKQPVGGVLIFKFRNCWIAEYSGHFDNAPPGTDQLLYWHAIRAAKADRADHFSFGRTSPDNTGLLEYKRRWATVEDELTDFVWSSEPDESHRGSHLGSHSDGAYAIARLFQRAPASIRRYLGDFCYRHLG